MSMERRDELKQPIRRCRLNESCVKALTDRVPLVRAIGNSIFSGGRIGTAEGRLVGSDGTLYAHGTTTCLIMDAR